MTTGTAGASELSTQTTNVKRPGIQLEIVDDADAVANDAARRVSRVLQGALAQNEVASIVLAGSGTAARFHRALVTESAAAGVDWTRVHVFFGDERAVPPGDPASNFGAASRDLLEPVGIPPGNVHRMQGEEDPERAARAYAAELARWFERHLALDVVMLGIGADGHTASLFPGSDALEESQRLCLATESPSPPHGRITLTYAALGKAQRIILLAHGEEKRAAIERSLDADDADPTPAARARSATGTALWIVDRAAAGPQC